MNTMTRSALAIAALGLALSGCTGSTDESPQAKAAAESTPQDAWAQSLCEGLAPTTAAIEPPDTASGDVAESKEAILTFLQTLQDRLKAQAGVLKDVGAPPQVDAAAYKKARQSLRQGATTLGGVIERLEEASPQDSSQMEASLLQVSETLAGSASYQGPLAELSASDDSLKKAFENSDQCVSIMS